MRQHLCRVCYVLIRATFTVILGKTHIYNVKYLPVYPDGHYYRRGTLYFEPLVHSQVKLNSSQVPPVSILNTP